MNVINTLLQSCEDNIAILKTPAAADSVTTIQAPSQLLGTLI